jgi:hypothetical protein
MFKKLLVALDDNHFLDDGMQWSGITLHIAPAYHHRFLSYEQELMSCLSSIKECTDAMQKISDQLSLLFKTGKTQTDPEVIDRIEQRNAFTAQMREYIAAYRAHPTSQAMPDHTIRDGTLHGLYQSQLDFLQAKFQGFDPKRAREFWATTDLREVEKLAQRIAKGK